MKRPLLALAAGALLLTGCSSSDTSTAVESSQAPASTTTEAAPSVTTKRAEPQTTTVEPVAVPAEAIAARDVFAETPGMSEFYEAVAPAGVGTTEGEVYALGMYIPSFCDMKAQLGADDETAVAVVPDDLAGSYGPITPDQAQAIVAAANEHVCA